MSVLRHVAAILFCITLSGVLKPMDEVAEKYFEKFNIQYQALIKATARGDIDMVMQIVQKKLDLIDTTDAKGNKLLTIAALNQHEALVKRLVLAGASIDALEYAQIWGILSQTPQSPQAHRIISFLYFTQTAGFSRYMRWKKMPANTSPVQAFISSMSNSLASQFETFISPINYYTPPQTRVPNSHSQALCAAAFDNNHTFIKQHSAEILAAISNINAILAWAASVATRECANEYLALYILFCRDEPLKDIFFARITGAQ